MFKARPSYMFLLLSLHQCLWSPRRARNTEHARSTSKNRKFRRSPTVLSPRIVVKWTRRCRIDDTPHPVQRVSQHTTRSRVMSRLERASSEAKTYVSTYSTPMTNNGMFYPCEQTNSTFSPFFPISPFFLSVTKSTNFFYFVLPVALEWSVIAECSRTCAGLVRNSSARSGRIKEEVQ